MADFYKVLELGVNSSGLPFLVLRGGSRIISYADGALEYRCTQRDGSINSLWDNRTKRPEYYNPGHHVKGHPEFRGGGSKRTELSPNNHNELWDNAIPDTKGPLTNEGLSKNWYAKDKVVVFIVFKLTPIKKLIGLEALVEIQD